MSITPLIIVCLQNPTSDQSAEVIEEEVEAIGKEITGDLRGALSLHIKQVKEALCDFEAYQKVGKRVLVTFISVDLSVLVEPILETNKSIAISISLDASASSPESHSIHLSKETHLMSRDKRELYDRKKKEQ